MWAGLTGGAGMMVTGWLFASEFGSMLTGYGLLFVLAAAYLGAGLAIRDRVRAASVTRRNRVDSHSLMGRRVF